MKTNISVHKQWFGVPTDVSTPEIQAVLYINGKVTDTTVTLNTANHYTADFDNLDETDASGRRIVYTVAEANVPAKYVAITAGPQVVKNSVVELQNRYQPDLTNLQVVKTWQNVQTGVALPAVTVVLYRNGVATAQQATLSAETQWQAAFSGLAKTDDQGNLIAWTAKEENIPAGFTATYQINGMETVITNTAKLGMVTLHKVDVVTGAALSGAVFNLLDGQGNVVKSGLTTDFDGNLTVNDLVWGNYSFVETKAPAGYELSTKPLMFTVNDQTANTGVQLTYTNAQLPQPPTVYPPTGEYPHTPEQPHTPEVPETPNTPSTPEVPSTPTTPATPEVPNVPSTPDVPGIAGPKGHFPKEHQPKGRQPKQHLPKQPHFVNHKIVKHQPTFKPVLHLRHTAPKAGRAVLVVSGKPAKGHGIGHGKGTGLPQTGEQSNLWALVGAALFALLALFGLRRKFQN